MSEVQEILSRYPKAPIQVFVLWAPYLQRDSRATAQRASLYLTDSRVRHYWDLWRFGSRTFSEQLEVPVTDAWDMFTFYKPQLLWGEAIPIPTFWMQNRSLSVGRPYSKEALEAELKSWLTRVR